MMSIRKWWQRRRLLARLNLVRKQWSMLSAEQTRTMELLNDGCRELIHAKTSTKILATELIAAREKVHDLTLHLNELGDRLDSNKRQEKSIERELELL